MHTLALKPLQYPEAYHILSLPLNSYENLTRYLNSLSPTFLVHLPKQNSCFIVTAKLQDIHRYTHTTNVNFGSCSIANLEIIYSLQSIIDQNR